MLSYLNNFKYTMKRFERIIYLTIDKGS